MKEKTTTPIEKHNLYKIETTKRDIYGEMNLMIHFVMAGMLQSDLENCIGICAISFVKNEQTKTINANYVISGNKVISNFIKKSFDSQKEFDLSTPE